MDLINALETMAAHGVAPKEGCSLFGIGHEDTFRRLKNVYLINRMAKRGGSAEKFVVGPFGSGKTHFLRQLMEIARDIGCVTSEVCLDKDIDYTNRIMVYREIVRSIQVPGYSGSGIRQLVVACVENVRSSLPDPQAAEAAFQGWVRSISQADLRLDAFARVAQKAVRYYDQGDEDAFNSACQWLGGIFDNKNLSTQLREPIVQKTELNLFAGRAMFSLFQFIRYAGLKGTVVCYDEADIGFQVDRKKMQLILSMLRADIGVINDLSGGAVLIVYALTDDVVRNMEQYMALKQRIFSEPGHSFLEGNDYAAIIDLSFPTNRQEELKGIGHRLTDLLYKQEGNQIQVDKSQVINKIDGIAEAIVEEDISSSSRREMVRRTSVLLLNILNHGSLEAAATADPVMEEDEV